MTVMGRAVVGGLPCPLDPSHLCICSPRCATPNRTTGGTLKDAGLVTHPGREPECLHGVATSGSCYECASATLKDSGTRREFDTGAVRDGGRGRGRFDLNPIYGELLIAQQMEAGAAKYSARNWEQGMPLSVFANSAKRHLAKLIAGFDDEPHLAAALWNLSCLAEGQKRIELGLWPKSLDDLPKTYAGQDPGF